MVFAVFHHLTYKLILAIGWNPKSKRPSNRLILSQKRKAIRYNPRAKFLTVTSHLSEWTSLKILGKSESECEDVNISWSDKACKYYHDCRNTTIKLFLVTIASQREQVKLGKLKMEPVNLNKIFIWHHVI